MPDASDPIEAARARLKIQAARERIRAQAGGATATAAPPAAPDPTEAMSPAEFAEFTTKNRPRDAAEAKRWTERVDREAPELAKYRAEGGKPHQPDALDKIAAIAASPVTGAIRSSERMSRTIAGWMGMPTGDSSQAPGSTGFTDSPRLRGTEDKLNESFWGETALAGGHLVGHLPSLATGAGALSKVVPAARAFPIAMGAQAAVEHDSIVEGGKALAFGELGGVFHRTLGGALTRLDPRIGNALFARVTSGSVSMATAGQAVQVVEKIAKGEPVTLDERAMARDAIFGGAMSAGGFNPADRPEAVAPAARARAAESALRQGRDPVAEVNALRLGREDPFVEPAATVPYAPPVKDEAIPENKATVAPAAAEAAPAPPTAVRPAVEARQPLPTEADPALGRFPAEVPVQRASLPSEGPIDATSIKNRIVNRERLERGLGDMAEPVRQKWGEVAEKAMGEIAENPQRPVELVAELVTNPRPHTPTEAAILDIHRVNLKKARAAADAFGVEAQKRGDLDGVAEAKARADLNSAQFLEAEIASKTSGTETARALAFRRAEMAQDYSLLAMETRRRAENDYKPLTEKQAAETKALQARLEKAVADRDVYAARLLEVEAKRAATRESRAAPGKYGESNKIVSRERADAIKAELREMFSATTLRSGFDAVSALPKLAELGVYHLEAGARTFTKWAAKMVADGGDGVKPHLDAAWIEAHKQVGVPMESVGRSEVARQRALETRLTNLAADLEQRVATGNVSAPRERTPLVRGPKAVELEARVNLATKAWNEALFRDRLANRTAAQKVAGRLFEGATTARAMMTSLDFSAVLRQGGFVAFGHPVRAAKALPAMFRAALSKEGQARVEAEITMRPTYALAKKSGLFLSEHGPNTSYGKMEEAYMSRWADKIPLVAGSQRAYTTFLNRLRMDSFDAMVAGLSRGSTPTRAEAQAIASFVNIATGRGGKGDNKWLNGANGILFSPRLMASRFQLLAGSPMYGGTARTRALIAGEYARFLAGVGTLYALAKFAGGEVETDSTSSDFGKVRFGETRIDPLAGLSQSTVLIGRAFFGESTSVNGRVSELRNSEGRAPRRGVWEATTAFLRNKLAPIPAAGVNLLDGRNAFDEPTSLGKEAATLATPLSFRDIYDVLTTKHGVPEKAALGLLSIFGMGVKTYKE